MQQRLDTQRGADQRGCGGDPATAPQMGEAVHVEPCRRAGRDLLDASHDRGQGWPSCGDLGPGDGGEAEPHRDGAAVDDLHLDALVEHEGGGQTGGVHGPGQRRRQVHRDDLRGCRGAMGHGELPGVGREVVTATRRSPNAAATSPGRTSIVSAPVRPASATTAIRCRAASAAGK